MLYLNLVAVWQPQPIKRHSFSLLWIICSIPQLYRLSNCILADSTSCQFGWKIIISVWCNKWWPVIVLYKPIPSINPGLRSNVQVTRECFALDPCSFWLSALDTGIQGKTFAITLHFWTQLWCLSHLVITYLHTMGDHVFVILSKYWHFLNRLYVILKCNNTFQVSSILINWQLQEELF